MVDSSWDNSGLPPQRQGLPTWAKVLLGCGMVMALAIGGCVAAGIYGIRKVSEMGKAQWPAYVRTVKELQDPATTKALYDANPGLKRRFPDAGAFEAQISEWRPHIETPPAEMPPITSGKAISFQGRSSQVNGEGVQRKDGGVSGYRMGDRMLVVVWEEGRIVDIQFEKRNR
ncbi:MAG TPA: hypothetical protein VJ600_00015 [Holophagaceae bacterium]|nr:hypothetical protein [Holophagaceae bacterium]